MTAFYSFGSSEVLFYDVIYAFIPVKRLRKNVCYKTFVFIFCLYHINCLSSGYEFTSYLYFCHHRRNTIYRGNMDAF